MAERHAARPVRTQRESVLILCEGSRTEPNYLGAVVREFGLTAVEIPRNHNTDPIGLVRKAIDALKRDTSISMAFAVFDRDNHPSFDEAVRLAEQSPMFGTRLRIIRSYPSFEIWLLYHFEPCRAPLTCDQALNKLKTAYPEFEKGKAWVAEQVIRDLPKAIKNSKTAMADAVATGDFNPSSEMHILVLELMRMAV